MSGFRPPRKELPEDERPEKPFYKTRHEVEKLLSGAAFKEKPRSVTPDAEPEDFSPMPVPRNGKATDGPSSIKKVHAVYCPFQMPSTEADPKALSGTPPQETESGRLGEKWKGDFEKRAFRVIYHTPGQKVLADIPKTMVIYVLGHCNRGSTTISNGRGDRLDAQGLAQRLQDDGLKLEHEVIKLYACYGASPRKADGDKAARESFALGFLKALLAKDYKQLTLFAYNAQVFTPLPDSGVKLADRGDFFSTDKASVYRQKVVMAPPPPQPRKIPTPPQPSKYPKEDL